MKKVIIIGGGFAGSTIAKKLEKNFEVTLIDTEDFFEYTPGILRTLVEIEHYKKIQAKHENYLKKSNVVIGEVIKIGENFVKLKNSKKLNFDYLVIAAGSSYNEPIKEEKVFYATRIKHLKKSHKNLEGAKSVCVVGGGLVGVELVAEICTHYSDKKIYLIHSHDRLIERNNLKSSKYSEEFLKKNGVELFFEERVVSYNNNKIKTKKGMELSCDISFFTVGIKPNYDFVEKKYVDDKGIKVNSKLQVNGLNSVFAAGDITNVKEEKTAQNAEMQAHVVVKNIEALEKNRNLIDYEPKKKLMAISLGKNDGILEYKNFTMKGKIPAFVKFLIEKWIMWGYR